MGRHRRHELDIGLDILADALPPTPERWQLDTRNGVDYYRLPTGDDISSLRPTRRERARIWLVGAAAAFILAVACFIAGLTVITVGKQLFGI